MKEKFMKINNYTVRYHEWGNKENPTIICLHGLGSTSLSFIEIAEEIQNKYHIISIDLPGHGKTDPFSSQEEFMMPSLVSWLNQIIKEITDKPVYLLAHSYGADIALNYLARYKDNVIMTMLIDGGFYFKDDIYELSKQGIEAFGYASIEEEVSYHIDDFDNYCHDSYQECVDEEKQNYVRWSDLLETAMKDLVRVVDGKYRWAANGYTAEWSLRSMYNYPTDKLFDKLPDSIYLLRSTEPESLNEIRDILTEKFINGTGGKLKKIEGACHMVHWDKPHEVINEICSWFI